MSLNDGSLKGTGRALYQMHASLANSSVAPIANAVLSLKYALMPCTTKFSMLERLCPDLRTAVGNRLLRHVEANAHLAKARGDSSTKWTLRVEVGDCSSFVTATVGSDTAPLSSLLRIPGSGFGYRARPMAGGVTTASVLAVAASSSCDFPTTMLFSDTVNKETPCSGTEIGVSLGHERLADPWRIAAVGDDHPAAHRRVSTSGVKVVCLQDRDMDRKEACTWHAGKYTSALNDTIRTCFGAHGLRGERCRRVREGGHNCSCEIYASLDLVGVLWPSMHMCM